MKTVKVKNGTFRIITKMPYFEFNDSCFDMTRDDMRRALIYLNDERVPKNMPEADSDEPPIEGFEFMEDLFRCNCIKRLIEYQQYHNSMLAKLQFYNIKDNDIYIEVGLTRHNMNTINNRLRTSYTENDFFEPIILESIIDKIFFFPDISKKYITRPENRPKLKLANYNSLCDPKNPYAYPDKYLKTMCTVCGYKLEKGTHEHRHAQVLANKNKHYICSECVEKIESGKLNELNKYKNHFWYLRWGI